MSAAVTQPTQPAPQLYYKHSGFITRFFALLVDGIVLLIITFMLSLIFKNSDERSSKGLFILLSFTYHILFVYLYSATPGKMLLHLKIAGINYQKLTFMQVLKREIVGKIISGLVFNLGYLWVAIDDKKQGWHDKIAKTYVIESKPMTYEQHQELQKDQRSRLPVGLIIAGLIEAFFPLFIVFRILPTLTGLFSDTGQSYNSNFSYGLFGLLTLLSLAQIVYGIILFNKQRKQGNLTASEKSIAKILVVIGAGSAILVIPVMVLTVILPIYRLTTTF